MEELKQAAFEFLLLHPGSEFADWQRGLISQYPTEVADALGCDLPQVHARLAALWQSEYRDLATGLDQRYSEWAMSFANENAVVVYYALMNACKELKRLKISKV
jgi:hypothetical protein